MTDFELRETEKFVIHWIDAMEPARFVGMILNNHKDNAIWCDGIMMFIIPSPTTDAMIESARDGKEEHLLAVYYAKQEKYVETLASGNGMKITLTHAESDFMRGLAKFVQEQI